MWSLFGRLGPVRSSGAPIRFSSPSCQNMAFVGVARRHDSVGLIQRLVAFAGYIAVALAAHSRINAA